jgi:hypothetical protein
MGRGTVSYKSKQLTCVAQPTFEVEYYSAADATEEVIHLRQTLWEIFSTPAIGATTILEDNQIYNGY